MSIEHHHPHHVEIHEKVEDGVPGHDAQVDKVRDEENGRFAVREAVGDPRVQGFFTDETNEEHSEQRRPRLLLPLRDGILVRRERRLGPDAQRGIRTEQRAEGSLYLTRSTDGMNCAFRWRALGVESKRKEIRRVVVVVSSSTSSIGLG